MIVPRYFRTQEWWEPKLAPILSIGLLTIHVYAFESAAYGMGFLFFLFVSLGIGASYVSLINDFTDLEEDLKAGKSNRLLGVSKSKQRLLISATLVGILIAIYILLPFVEGLLLFLGALLVYTLYSVPPFRLKNRGGWGVLADSLGAHAFPSMGIFAILSQFMIESVDWMVLLLIGTWSLFYGLRGILGHQYSDLENDESVGLNTFATRFPIDKMRQMEWPILLVEQLALIGLLVYFKIGLLLLLLTLYYGYVLLLRWKRNVPFVIILHPPQPDWNILMATYYQVLLPIGLLGMLGMYHSWVYLLIPVFVLIFPNDILRNSALVTSLFHSKEIPEA
ncbi:UbiA family prenyltransferase [Algoriphagus aquimarinus]|uniref:4-hydroxybenzoate polyprenyltransferase n=1 Tax=Algoriphagus aquimarinus TaxID=237018 RepID=A0A1I0Z6P0_9BACT|nr:UbiA family prenyltransferase [Algoriphagus aquimarinus]SFB20088.1 4-hydroxybenzoate polyprenyltransferase [Algoriphagus aquimarinus]